MRTKQQLLLSEQFKVGLVHGGKERVGKRKIRRPLDTKRAVQVTMRAEAAQGEWKLCSKKNLYRVKDVIAQVASRYGISLYKVCVNSNHLHLLVRGRTRRDLQGFLRLLPSRIAQMITGAKKGKPLAKRFWDKTVHTRLVTWGKAYRSAKQYLVMNLLEAQGLIPYQPRNVATRQVDWPGIQPYSG